jgi:hypothetical protein
MPADDRSVITHLQRFVHLNDPLETVGGYHWGPIDNLASILKFGLLSHNEVRKQNLPHVDLSQAEVQNKRAVLSLYRGGPPLHDYANLSWHPRNAALYKVVMSLTAIDLVVTEFGPEIFQLPQIRAVPQHAVSGVLPYAHSSHGQLWWARQQHLDLIQSNFPDWDLDSWRGDGVDMWGQPTYTNALKKSLLQAEVLVPERIGSEFIQRFYVKSPEAAQLVLAAVATATAGGWTPRTIPIVVCGHLFFETW